jgi:hypothetical protein
VSGLLDSSSYRQGHFRSVGIAITPSRVSQVHLVHTHAVWSIPDALGMSSCHSECPRRAEIAFMPFRVSQTYWNYPHAIWSVPDALDHLHAAWSVPDTFEPPSRHLGRLEWPSRHLEYSRHVIITLTPSGASQMQWIAFMPFGASQTHWSRPHAVWDAWDHLHAV